MVRTSKNRMSLCFAAQLLLIVALPAQAVGQQFTLPNANLHPGFPYLFTDADVDCSPNESNRSTLRVELPVGATLLQVYTQMANYPWVGGGERCRADVPPAAEWSDCPHINGECGISWSKVRNVNTTAVLSRQIVTADFHNWKHDNIRWARLLVFYTP